MKPDGSILDDLVGALRERTEDRKRGGEPQLHTKTWDMPGGKTGFQTATTPVHYVDDLGEVRTRRLKWNADGDGYSCETDARKVYVTGPSTWKMVHRNGTVMDCRLYETGQGDLSAGDENQPAPNLLDYTVGPNTVRRFALTAGPVRDGIWLYGDNAPRDWTWEYTGFDIADNFKFEPDARACRENLLDTADRSAWAAGRPRQRWLEVDDFGGPQLELLPDGRQRITVRKQWTGRVWDMNEQTRVTSPVPEALAGVEYPVKMNDAISETIPTDNDDVEEYAGALETGDAHNSTGKDDTETWTGLRFTTIGPSADDTIVDAAIGFGVYFIQANTTSGDTFDTHAAVGSTGSDAWSGTSRPTQRTLSNRKVTTDIVAMGTGNDKSVDVTRALQEWVYDSNYDGNVAFVFKPMSGLGVWRGFDIPDTGATWGASTPFPQTLTGNYVAATTDVKQWVTLTRNLDEYSPLDTGDLYRAISSGSNRVVLAIVPQGYNGAGSTALAVSVGGQSLTLLGTRQTGTNNAISIWYALESTVASMSGTTVSVSWSTTDAHSAIAILELQNRSQTPPTLQTDTDVTAGDIGNASLSVSSGDIVLAGCVVSDLELAQPTGLTGGYESQEEINGLSWMMAAFGRATGSTINAEFTSAGSLTDGLWVAAAWPAASGFSGVRVTNYNDIQ